MTLPEEFIRHIEPLLNDEMDSFLKTFDETELHGLRFRNEKIRDRFIKEDYDGKEELLLELGIQSKEEVPWAPLSYYYDATARPGLSPLHEMGIYYIQEPSAMGPAALLAPNPGERVLDLCAAPGGKTTELATYLGGEGLLVANEIHPARAKILASNIERMGIANALVTNEDSNKLRAHFPSFFHRILVDAPCSGEGMFRKNPDAIAEWSMENVRICAKRQAEILDNAAEMLMPGGTLVYSTCTFAKEENEDSVQAFLMRHPEFELVESRRFWPHKEKGEGHFMALFQKSGELTAFMVPSTGKKLDKQKELLFMDFLKSSFCKEYIGEFMEKAKKAGFFMFGEQLYLAPPQCPSINGLKVMRAGLALGEMKKNRFEPSHAWALNLDISEVKRSFSLSRDEALAYIRGEAKQGIELAKSDMGWCLLSFMDYPIGWGKASGNQIKNHYPKGLRR